VIAHKNEFDARLNWNLGILILTDEGKPKNLENNP
jgi:hypothetical protein